MVCRVLSKFMNYHIYLFFYHLILSTRVNASNDHWMEQWNQSALQLGKFEHLAFHHTTFTNIEIICHIDDKMLIFWVAVALGIVLIYSAL